MSSNDGSSSSRQTSLAPSSASSYPFMSGSAHQQSFAGLSDSDAKSTQVYVSPYPPLSPVATAAKPSAASSGAQRATSRAQPFYSAATTSPSSTGDDDEDDDDDNTQMQEAQKQGLIEALNQHRINTLGELRRVERIFASLGSPDLTQPMTAAWVFYVNSNTLLTELRSLTRNYPFSSELLDEAKRRVHADPASNRSWNYCWLVLAKIHTDRLIPTYARSQATRPQMWGGVNPESAAVDQLTAAFVREWNTALSQLLRYWETAPVRPR